MRFRDKGIIFRSKIVTKISRVGNQYLIERTNTLGTNMVKMKFASFFAFFLIFLIINHSQSNTNDDSDEDSMNNSFTDDDANDIAAGKKH